MIEFLKAFLFGIVEGITEWLPISSTGHMILLNEFVKLDVSDEFYSMFEVVIQLGAIMAVVILFWNDIFPFGKPEGRRRRHSVRGIKRYIKPDIFLLWAKILVACVPAAIVGILFNDLFEALFYNYITVAIMLILFGVLQRVLDRMALTDRQALLLVALIFVGGWLPDIRLGMVSINIGGALVPLGVCVYLFFHAGTGRERIRCLVASVLTAAVIAVISLLFPADPVAMPFDPMVLYGLCGGIIAWLTGRSRRSAFIAGVLGMILADTAIGVVNWTRGVQQVLYLGGAGALDAVVLSGVTAVMLCELFGEIMERMARGKTDGSTLQGGQSA